VNHELTLQFKWPFGLSEHNTSGDSALFRVFSRIKDGPPLGSFNVLFLDTGQPLPSSLVGAAIQNDVRFLGALVHSQSGMILYVPGFRGSKITRFDDHLRPGRILDPFQIDHFSLEPGFDRWHITNTDRDERLQRLRVKRVTSDLVYWFGMSIRDYADLEPAYRHNTWSFSSPATDSKRRFDNIVDAYKNAKPHIIQASNARIDSGPAFLHLQFVVRTGKARVRSAITELFPLPPLATILTPQNQVPVCVHSVKIPGFLGAIDVAATMLSGTLSDAVVVTCPAP
jgi:hypothetical protein